MPQVTTLVWKPWTWKNALAFVRHLETDLRVVGWHCTITGGVLHKGSSSHDLDVIVYPHKPTTNRELARKVLRKHGCSLFRSIEQVRRHWRSIGSNDTKYVEVWTDLQERRIDIFWLK